MGYHVISFAYDDVEQRPELCMTLLRMVLGRFLPSEAPVSRVLLLEQEVVRLAVQLARPIRPQDVKEHFNITYKTAIRILRSLTEKGWLLPSADTKQQRIARYELARGVLEYF
ncbi:hypothetical protein D3C73_875990 [compost metagenome]